MGQLRIISGGQTGADRGALDAALQHGVPCGGWCPAGRLAEDGVIPEYLPVAELAGGSYADRTRRNVRDADGTAVFFCATLAGGSLLTRHCAESEAKPLLLIDAGTCSSVDAAVAISDFVRRHDIQVLNVAGPRTSEWPEAEAWVHDAVSRAIELL